MSNFNRGPSIDSFYQVSVHLAKRFQRRRFFFKSTNQKQEFPVAAMFVNGSEEMLPIKFRFIWPSGFRGEDLRKITLALNC
jgi:hypothetical protein